jgi:hypothetical protein
LPVVCYRLPFQALRLALLVRCFQALRLLQQVLRLRLAALAVGWER